MSLTWVRNHHQDAVGAVLDNVRDDELENVDVALHQVKTALALLLSSASSHHHHLGVGCHTVVCQNNRKGDVRMEYQDNSFSRLNTRLESSFYLFSFYFCIFAIVTFVCHNLVRLEEKGSMLQVHGLTLQLVLHHINQGQLIAQVLIIYVHTYNEALITRQTVYTARLIRYT